MSRPALAFFVATIVRTAAAQEVTEPEHVFAPKQAVLVRVGVASSSPGGGLSYERMVNRHLALVVGADAELVRAEEYSRAGGWGELGARWYFFDRPLSGP
jgi:hypothetical protein